MTYLVGKIALDITAGAPNNGRGADNVAHTKKLYINGKAHPYVSAQAFRRWLRDSLPPSETPSPVYRTGKGKRQQAHTAGRPDRYLDDDLFGYMIAVKSKKSKNSEIYQRDTVLATGTLVAVAPTTPERDFGTMSRGFPADANPVIHEHEHYTAELAGDVLLDLPRIGVFEREGGLRCALSPDAVSDALAAGAEEVQFRGVTSLRLNMTERRRRAAVLLRTLAEVRGGAKKALHYGDRAPALVLLAPLKGGNNPFTRVLTATPRGVVFDIDTFREEKEAWADELDGPIHIGWAPGFLGKQREDVRSKLVLDIETGEVIIGHPRQVLKKLAASIEAGEYDHWFEDEPR